MKNLWIKVKQKYKETLVSVSVALLVGAVIFLRHNPVICNDLNNFLSVCRIDRLEFFFTSIFVPSKTLVIILTQIVSILCLFQIFLFISILVIKLIQILNQHFTLVEDEKQTCICASDAVLCGRMTYRETLRFLC